MIDARLFCKDRAPTNKAILPVHPKAAVIGNPNLPGRSLRQLPK